jgi:hypothetical protein
MLDEANPTPLPRDRTDHSLFAIAAPLFPDEEEKFRVNAEYIGTYVDLCALQNPNSISPLLVITGWAMIDAIQAAHAVPDCIRAAK